MRAYLLAGWLGGLRLAEAAALEWGATEQWPYLDLLRDRIILPAAFVKAAEDQWVPLDPLLREALELLPRLGKKVFRFVAKNGHAVCLNAVGERVIRLAKKAGVKLTMHSLRKGFGCRYAGKVPAQVLQRLMRHSNISTTMDFYANVDATLEEAVLGPKRNSSRNTRPTAEPVGTGGEAQALGGKGP
jgi:integrase